MLLERSMKVVYAKSLMDEYLKEKGEQPLEADTPILTGEFTVREAKASDDYVLNYILQVVMPDIRKYEYEDIPFSMKAELEDLHFFAMFVTQFVKGNNLPFEVNIDKVDKIEELYQFISNSSKGIPFMRAIRDVFNQLGE